MHVSYDNLGGEGKVYKMREFLSKLERENLLETLLEHLCKVRPDVNWYIAVTRIPIHVVIVTMTREEFYELLEESQDDIELFSQLSTFSDASVCYDEKSRDDWRPFYSSKNQNKSDVLKGTIRDLINQFAENLSILQNGDSYQIEFIFHSDEFFNTDAKNAIWDQIEREGCLFIIDSISLFHSNVFSTFQNKLIGWNGHLSTFIVSPIDIRELQFNKMLENHVSKTFGHFLRHYDNLSPHHGFLIGNEVDLFRNIKTSLQGWDFHIRRSWLDQYERAGIPVGGIKDEMRKMK
jgi:hypothetical protein